MKDYPGVAVERAMKVQEVILRAMARRITWWQAAEIFGISVRSLRRFCACSRFRSSPLHAWSAVKTRQTGQRLGPRPGAARITSS